MKKITKEDFIQKANMIHYNKYDYSKFEYLNNRIKSIIICPIHGEFEQTADNHVNQKQGCKICGKISSSTNRTKSLEEYITDANKKHDFKYDYSKVVYNGNKKFITIICPIHGEFNQRADEHLKYGCQKCAVIERAKLQIKNIEYFLEKVKHIHGDLYDYSKFEYIGDKVKSIIICKKHGEFLQSPNSHTNRKAGCPICKLSKGELQIRNWLDLNNIKYKTEQKFRECKHNSYLPFDFYLPELDICIEYDGIQHFKPMSYGSDNTLKTKINNLKTIQYRDNIKTQFCIDNNIKLIRIPYTEFDNITTILERELCLDMS